MIFWKIPTVISLAFLMPLRELILVSVTVWLLSPLKCLTIYCRFNRSWSLKHRAVPWYSAQYPLQNSQILALIEQILVFFCTAMGKNRSTDVWRGLCRIALSVKFDTLIFTQTMMNLFVDGLESNTRHTLATISGDQFDGSKNLIFQILGRMATMSVLMTLE